VLRKALDRRAKVGAHAGVQPVTPPAATGRYGLRGAVKKALIRGRHSVRGGRRCDAEIGHQHQTGAAVNGDVNDAPDLVGDLSEFIKSIGKCRDIEYLFFVVAHCVTIAGLFREVLTYEGAVPVGRRRRRTAAFIENGLVPAISTR
jgi:hypothetical protein